MTSTVRTRTRHPVIDYESEAFPTSRGLNGTDTLSVSWDDLLWAAVTLGRPNLQSVFRHGVQSVYEALFRWSLIRLALEQHGPAGAKFWRTDAYKFLDPTEKGFVSYFVGMTLCKVFADKKLGAPWLLHLDVFRSQLNARTLKGRSRPDLVGQETLSGEWHAFESKGRASVPGRQEKTNAKAQAQRLVSVDGKACSLHIGAISYFRNDSLRFYWRDPEPSEQFKQQPIELRVPKDAWRYYYEPITALLRPRSERSVKAGADQSMVAIDEADVAIGAHPKILNLLLAHEWDKAYALARELGPHFQEEGYRHDGLILKSGPSWQTSTEIQTRS